jgi:hypothetical protein
MRDSADVLPPGHAASTALQRPARFFHGLKPTAPRLFQA